MRQVVVGDLAPASVAREVAMERGFGKLERGGSHVGSPFEMMLGSAAEFLLVDYGRRAPQLNFSLLTMADVLTSGNSIPVAACVGSALARLSPVRAHACCHVWHV